MSFHLTPFLPPSLPPPAIAATEIFSSIYCPNHLSRAFGRGGGVGEGHEKGEGVQHEEGGERRGKEVLQSPVRWARTPTKHFPKHPRCQHCHTYMSD